MCDHSPNREATMVTIAPGVHCDPCLEPIIRALHTGEGDLPTVPTQHGPDPIRTVASCCGHGRRPGRITLADGRELLLVDASTMGQIAGLWPGINDSADHPEPAEYRLTAIVPTPDLLAEVRALHAPFEYSGGWPESSDGVACNHCETEYPCETVTILDREAGR